APPACALQTETRRTASQCAHAPRRRGPDDSLRPERGRARTPPGSGRRCDRGTRRALRRSRDVLPDTVRSSLFDGRAQQRLEPTPHVIEYLRLCGGNGMNAIGLKHGVIVPEALEQERDERRFALRRHLAERGIESLHVTGPIV